MYQLIEKVIGNLQNFTVIHSPLDLSIILLLEHKTISKISIKASKFPAPIAVNVNFLLTNSVYLMFTGNYTDDDAQIDTR